MAPTWKPIWFAPQRGSIVLCDFDLARVSPEINKRRQAIVLSLSKLNHKHAQGPGLCVVVPTSSQEPESKGPEDLVIPAGKYWSFDKDSWVQAKHVSTVSHERLGMPHRDGRPSLHTENLDAADLARVEAAVKYALGIP